MGEESRPTANKVANLVEELMILKKYLKESANLAVMRSDQNYIKHLDSIMSSHDVPESPTPVQTIPDAINEEEIRKAEEEIARIKILLKIVELKNKCPIAAVLDS